MKQGLPCLGLLLILVPLATLGDVWPHVREAWMYRALPETFNRYNIYLNLSQLGSTNLDEWINVNPPVLQPLGSFEFFLIGHGSSNRGLQFDIADSYHEPDTGGGLYEDLSGWLELSDGDYPFQRGCYRYIEPSNRPGSGGPWVVTPPWSGYDAGISIDPASKCVDFEPISAAAPMLSIDFDSVTLASSHLRIYETFHLRAAPIRDLWFSVDTAFDATNSVPGAPPYNTTNRTSFEAGDILSIDGRIVRAASDILQKSGFENVGGVGSFSTAPGGRLNFTPVPNRSALETNSDRGIDLGDIISDTGELMATNQFLTRLFEVSGFAPGEIENLGLGGIQGMANGEFLFSVLTNSLLSSTGRYPSADDILSSRGFTLRSYGELISRFHPTNEIEIAPAFNTPTAPRFGLGPFFVWPSGEVWFSVKTNFHDAYLGDITPGDILSDNGSIVFRMRDLLAQFGFGSSLTSGFNLRGFYIFTDAAPAPVAPVITGVSYSATNNTATLSWRTDARAVQVLASSSPLVPFAPATAILPIPEATTTVTNATAGEKFYKILGW